MSRRERIISRIREMRPLVGDHDSDAARFLRAARESIASHDLDNASWLTAQAQALLGGFSGPVPSPFHVVRGGALEVPS